MREGAAQFYSGSQRQRLFKEVLMEVIEVCEGNLKIQGKRKAWRRRKEGERKGGREEGRKGGREEGRKGGREEGRRKSPF
jgi:hypothetical protein